MHLDIISLNFLNILPKLTLHYLKYIAFNEIFFISLTYLKLPWLFKISSFLSEFSNFTNPSFVNSDSLFTVGR